jgi:translocator protein
MEEAPILNPSSRLISFLVSQLAAFSGGFIGSQLAMGGLQSWYPVALKPVWAIPAWGFIPLGSIVAFALGVGIFKIAGSSPTASRAIGLSAIAVPLAGLALWHWIFFAGTRTAMAVWIAVLTTITFAVIALVFARSDRRAGLLAIPMALWCAYLSLLTWQVARDNPTGTNPKDGEIRITIEDPKSGPLLPE